MIAWFGEKAPIRRKFDALAVAYILLAAIAVGTTWLALTGLTTAPVILGGAAASFIGTVVVAIGSKKLVCDPYVNTVVRMEGLAAGDLLLELAGEQVRAQGPADPAAEDDDAPHLSAPSGW